LYFCRAINNRCIRLEEKMKKPIKQNRKSDKKPDGKYEKPGFRKKSYGKNRRAEKPPKNDDLIRLNKYLADAGICSRREADKLIESGVVQINGKIVTQLGTKVSRDDKVQYGGETLKREKLQYVLLNKPKDFITTSDDPQNRRTVMNLVEKACHERIYPVGRLDRNTLGLLLFTNDGELAKKLTHPKHNIKKIYHVFLNTALTKNDMIKLGNGVELDDGFIQPDKISYVTGENDKKQIGLELHSGRNRIVRRMFEHLGYKVIKLDRSFFAGLTKKDLPRGKWRKLTEKEIGLLKRM